MLTTAKYRSVPPPGAELNDGQNIQRKTVPMSEKISEWYSPPRKLFSMILYFIILTPTLSEEIRESMSFSKNEFSKIFDDFL